jgi:hypothetical protein
VRKQRSRGTVLLREQRRQQMNRFDVLVVVPDSQALGVGERFLKFGSEFVDSHFSKAPILNTFKMRRFEPVSSMVLLVQHFFAFSAITGQHDRAGLRPSYSGFVQRRSADPNE